MDYFERTVEILDQDGKMLDAAHARFWVDPESRYWGATLTPAVGTFHGEWILLGEVHLHLPADNRTVRIAIPPVPVTSEGLPDSVEVIGSGPPPF
jgi:hypothetical protein